MTRCRRLGVVGSMVWLLACEGSLVGGGVERDGGERPETDAGESGVDGGGTGMDGSAPRPDAGTEVPVDAGPCGATTLAASLSTTPITGLAASGTIFAAPTPTGGVVIAVGGRDGVTLQRVSGDGTLAGAPIAIAGTELHGLDVSPDAFGVMVARGTDALYLVVVRPDGSTVFERRLLGEVDHAVTNNEWFGTGIRAGRLLWDGTRWAAYYTVNRLWDDGIAHYGDQLTFWRADGAADGSAWGWGCSHSMEVRLAHNGTRLGPVCSSDCYPSKGVHFDHRTARLYTDEDGSNCAGRYGTSLGGVVPMPDGFWVAFTATDARASHDVALARVGNDGRADAPIWLTEDATDDRALRSARYGAGLVIAWRAGGVDRFARLDAAGAIVEGPVDLSAASLEGSSDFFVYGGSSDVGWVTSSGSGLVLARLRSCE